MRRVVSSVRMPRTSKVQALPGQVGLVRDRITRQQETVEHKLGSEGIGIPESLGPDGRSRTNQPLVDVQPLDRDAARSLGRSQIGHTSSAAGSAPGSPRELTAGAIHSLRAHPWLLDMMGRHNSATVC